VASGGDVSARVFEAPGFERSFERPLGIGPLDARTADVLAPTLRLLVDTLRVLERALVAPIQCARPRRPATCRARRATGP